MQVELREVLRHQRDHASVVRSRAQLAEDHLAAAHEELDAEDPGALGAGNAVGDRLRHALRRTARRGRHAAGHPRLAVVAALLPVPDRLDEHGAPPGRAPLLHRELRDLVVEVDELLDDDKPRVAAHAGHRILPRRAEIRLLARDRLPLARAAHDRLDDAWQADPACAEHRILQLRGAARICVAGGAQPKPVRRKVADGVAVHREVGRSRARDHGLAALLEREQLCRADRLDLRHHEVRLVPPDDPAQRCAVEHVDDLVSVCHLHRRRARVAVHGDHAAPEPLGADHRFLAEFARAEEEQGGCHAREGIPRRLPLGLPR